jgi:microcystin-dependent protein
MALIAGLQYSGTAAGTILPCGNGVVISTMTTTGNPTTVTTTTPHGLASGDSIVISGTATTPTATLGVFTVASVVSATQFTVAVNVTGGTLTGVVSKIPARMLLCDGSSYSRTTYSALFAAIGTSFGSVDGNSFNVPDFRGRFLRGVDGSASRDPDRAARTAMNTGGNTGNLVGSVQTDEIRSHTHTYTPPVFSHDEDQNGAGLNSFIAGAAINTSAAGGNETRPLNAYVNYCIAF